MYRSAARKTSVTQASRGVEQAIWNDAIPKSAASRGFI
jgi:hypothetical protein